MKNYKKLSLAFIFGIAFNYNASAQTSPDPLTTVICQGTTKTLSSSVNGTSYQWYKDGTLIGGSNGKTYDAGSAGTYVVVAINEHGCSSDASDGVKVFEVPVPAPVITALNNGSCFTAGSNVELTASGMPTSGINGLSYKYEWRKTGSATIISNDEKISLNTVAESGGYTVTIVPIWSGVDLACSKISAETQVTINPFAAKPTIATSIGNYASDDEKRSGIICERNEVTLTASVTSSDPNISTSVTYQWLKDGIEFAGQTNSTLVLSNIGSTNSGSYTVVATTSTGCKATSDAVVIDVKVRPAQPTINY